MTSHERAPGRPDTASPADQPPTPESVGLDVVGVPVSRSTLGRVGEDLAVCWLVDHGMQVVERNWRCEHGEVDIVALDGACLVICEVKARRSLAFGEPVEAVTRAKAARLRRLAAVYARTHDTGAAHVRVDVLGILFRANHPPLVRHVRGVGS